MKTSSALRLGSAVILGVASVPSTMLAHPGHDGHELTWDFGHLAAHPWATGFWLVIIGASVASAVQILRSSIAARSTARAKRESSSR